LKSSAAYGGPFVFSHTFTEIAAVTDAIWSNITGRPFNLEFAVTHNCNSRCLMCNQWQNKSIDELTLEEISRIFLSYRDLKVVGITGGEPTLRTDLTEVIDVISRSQDLRMLFLTTNGHLPERTKHYVSKILDGMRNRGRCPLLRVLVSLDGPKEIHNRIRGVPTAYDNALRTIRLLADLQREYDNFRLGTITTYGPFNYEQFGEVLFEISKLSSEYDLESGICVAWRGNLYNNDIRFEHLRELVSWKEEIKHVLGKHSSTLVDGRKLFFDLSESFLKRWRQVVPCGAARIRYYMDACGRLFPCVVWDNAVADLRKNGYNLRAAIDSSRRHLVRKQVRDGQCPICFLTCEMIPSMMANPLAAIWRKYVP